MIAHKFQAGMKGDNRTPLTSEVRHPNLPKVGIHQRGLDQKYKTYLEKEGAWNPQETDGATSPTRTVPGQDLFAAPDWTAQLAPVSHCRGVSRDVHVSCRYRPLVFFLVTRVIPSVVRTCHISIGSRLRALGCEQNQSFWHLCVMFMVL